MIQTVCECFAAAGAAERDGWVLVHALWQFAVVVAVAAAVTAMLRPRLGWCVAAWLVGAVNLAAPVQADEPPQDTNAIASLTPEEAKKLAAEFKGDQLPLGGLTTFSPDASTALAEHAGCFGFSETAMENFAARARVNVTVVHEGGTSTDHKVSIYSKPEWAKGHDVVFRNECFAKVKSAHTATEQVLAATSDANLRGRRSTRSSQSTSKAGSRIGRSLSSPFRRTSNGNCGHTSPAASSASDSPEHAVLRAGRVLSWPSPARAAASVPPATAAGWHRQLRISSTASFPRCPCGSG